MHNIEAWLQESKTAFNNQSIDSLRQTRDMAKEHAKNLAVIARNKAIEGLPELRGQLSEHQKAVEQHLKKLERHASELLNPSFEDMENIQNHQMELARLEQICSRQDARDVADLKYVLDWLLSVWRDLRNDNSLDDAMLRRRLEDFKAELAAQIEEKELGLEAAALYDLVVADLEKTRKERSTLWLAEARNKCERTSELSTEQSAVLYAQLQEEPAYLAEQDRAVLSQLRSQLHAHLVQQKEAWLLQEFSRLPRERQISLFERLRHLMNI